jgi:hypothetical protein
MRILYSNIYWFSSNVQQTDKFLCHVKYQKILNIYMTKNVIFYRMKSRDIDWKEWCLYILESLYSILNVQSHFGILNIIKFTLNNTLKNLNIMKQVKIDIKDIFLAK